MNQYLKNIQDLLRQNKELGDADKEALIKTITEADKQWSITDFKLDRTEKVKKTTAILLEETIEELEQKRKAVETQNKELEIEAALEKIRSRSLAMYKSDELWEVVAVVLEKLQELKFSVDGAAFIVTFTEGLKVLNTWLASDQGQLYPTILELPYYDSPSINDIWKAKESELDFFSKTYSFEEKNHWLGYAFEHTGLKIMTHEFKNWVLEQPCMTQSIALGKNSMIGIHFHHQKSLSETEVDIVKRFSKVFDQAYVRFLDLQKAEAQAKEARIEAALEKVRARTMGMQRSDELAETAVLLFEQLKWLGLDLRGCGFNIWEKDEKTCTAWMSGPEGKLSPPFNLPLTGDPFFMRYYESRQKGEDFWVYETGEKELAMRYQYLRTLPVLGELLENDLKDGNELSLPSFVIDHAVNFSKGNLIFITHKPCPEAWDTFKRFGKVFEQTYTRFLDLQKAEAQAREAKIEAALERTRTQSMIMQHSKELDDTLRVFHQQVLLLGIHSAFSFLWLPDEEKDRHIFWAAWEENKDNVSAFKSKAINYPLDRNEPATAQCLVDWKSNEPVYSYHVPPDAVQNYFAAWQELIDGVEQLKPEYFSAGLYYVEAFMKYGCFGVIVANDLTGDEKKILGRFSIEFERTYTRFLDLQKSEAQARESKIQLALERVRARTMAMQKSNELMETAALLFVQLNQLGENIERTIIGVMNEEERVVDIWATRPDGSHMDKMQKFPIDEPVVMQKVYTAWRQQKKSIVIDLRGEELERYFEFLRGRSSRLNQESFSERRVENFVFFSKGLLGVISADPKIPADVELYERFAAVFEQTYTRFLDLQKAETQAREAKIEAALEKVRSRSLAMHKSHELQEVANTVFDRLNELEIETDSVNIAIFKEGSRDYDYWVASPFQKRAASFHMPYTELSLARDLIAAREGGMDYSAKTYSFEEKNAWFNYAFTNTDFKFLSEERKKFILSTPAITVSIAFSKYTGLQVTRYSTKLLSEGEADILKRFSKVFEQAYIRFLDLQKAEAQAREAKIETALEKVRSKTMAMHNSQDVGDTVATLFDEFVKLGIETFRCGIGIIHQEKKMEVWTAKRDADGKVKFFTGYMDMTIHPLLQGGYSAWWKKEESYVYELKGDDLKEYFTRSNNNPNYPLKYDIPSLPSRLIFSVFYFPEGFLFAFTLEELPAETTKIFKRFSAVFGQTYRRYLDLQKAETQAREAQIEAALERVRSRSMGMQKSEELKEVIQVVYEQFIHLNIKIEHTGFVMDFRARNDYDIWIADQLGVPSHVTIPYFDSVYYNRFNEAKEKGMEFFANRLNFEEKNRFYEKIFEHVPGLPEKTKYFLLSIPGLAISTVLLENVALYIENFSATPYSDEENAILIRFGKVFQQTYTRFLDLQKAEAQARESQIEAALERVRSRSMGMQKSEELRDVIQVVFEQLVQLNFEISNAGFLMDYRESDDYNIWMTDAYTEFPTKIHVPYFDNPFNSDYLDHRDKGPELFAKVYPFEEKNNWFVGVWKSLTGNSVETKKAILGLPALSLSRVFMKNIGLYLLNFTGTPYSDAENATLIRFAKVFEQTYTRFNDLKKAEAQAMEAVKRASVDRIRAEIASMRTTNDLERITPLIWNELTTLGVPFIRCGVFIMDEARQEVQTMLSTPEGRAIATMRVPYEFDLSITSNGVQFWRRKEVYTEYWDSTAFAKAWLKLSSLSRTSIGSPETEHPPGKLYLHLLPFLQGMLYVGSEAPLNEDELNLVQNLADTFSNAYARYEDFNKLESANIKIEKTLVDLKQTQAQLVQSEKMASLGELTAGIAHEIQNPLNFVNNFSELNKELLDELNEEIEKANYEEAKIIAKDIAGNEDKINHHGKRADAIVKGMLQHSRSSSATKEPTVVNDLADEYLRLAFHGLRAKDKSFNVTLHTDYDESIGKINIVPQDIGRVLLNLYNNAFYAVTEKKKQAGDNYEPTVSVTTKKINGKIIVSVADNGNGIPKKVMDKIFQPFFTTKPTGQGTGLGLSLSYDIMKAHGGEIKVETKEGEGSEFVIELPIV